MKKEIVFIAFTPYHLFCSMYYSITIKRHFGVESVLIWQEYADYNVDIELVQEAFDRILVNDSIIRNKDCFFKRFIKRINTGGYFARQGEVNSYVLKNNSNRIVFCFSDQDPTTFRLLSYYNEGKDNYVYLIEEGIGSYNYKIHSFEYTPIDYRYYLMYLYRMLGVVHGKYIGYSKLFNTWIVKHPDKMPSEKLRDHKIVQQNMFFYDKLWTKPLNRLNTMIDQTLVKFKLKKNYLLWVSGPLEECGLSEEKENDLLIQFSKSLPEEYVILIKLHPRENANKYLKALRCENIYLLDLKEISWIPVEYIANKLHVEVALTIMSSAARNLYDNLIVNKVIYFYKMFSELKDCYEVVDKDSEFGESFLVHSISDFKDVAYFLETRAVHRIKNKNAELNDIFAKLGVRGEDI